MGVLVRHTKRKMIRKGVAGAIGGIIVTIVALVMKLVGAEPDAHMVDLIAEPVTAAIATIVAGIFAYKTKSAKEDVENVEED